MSFELTDKEIEILLWFINPKHVPINAGLMLQMGLLCAKGLVKRRRFEDTVSALINGDYGITTAFYELTSAGAEQVAVMTGGYVPVVAEVR